jgi:iron-sulfur cluster repair protein YtfE (RIC family)
MKASQALVALVEQHARIRELAARTSTAATLYLAGGGGGEAFPQALAALRRALAEHNACEEAFLEPHLARDPAVGARRVSRMLEEHRAEHAAFAAALKGEDRELALRMPDLLEELEAHLQAEERTFLNAAVLKDPAG